MLASVAAEEISKSDVVSLVGSPRRKTPVYEPFGDENDSRVKSFPGDQFSDGTGDVHGKWVLIILRGLRMEIAIKRSLQEILLDSSILPLWICSRVEIHVKRTLKTQTK